MPVFYEFPAGETKIKNTIRIEVDEDLRQRKNLQFIVFEILLGVFRLKMEEIMCLQDQEGRGKYTVTFTNPVSCCNIYRLLSQKDLNDERLEGLRFFLLYGSEDVPLVVHMYDPHIETEDIATFLKRCCSEVRFSHWVKGGVGLWNGKRKFFVKFREDPDGIGGYAHPPSNFLIGRSRGYLFYSGMPLFCRKCLRFGHTQDACPEGKMARCSVCGRTGHVAAFCQFQKICNMCGKEGQIYKDCPSKAARKSYAEATKHNLVISESEPRSVAVTDPAKTTLSLKGKIVMGKKLEVKGVNTGRKAPEPEQTTTALLAVESAKKALGVRRKSTSLPVTTVVTPVSYTGSEQSAMKIQEDSKAKVTMPEHHFTVPVAVDPANTIEGRRASISGPEQVLNLLNENPGETVLEVQSESEGEGNYAWRTAERKKRSSKNWQSETVAEKSGIGTRARKSEAREKTSFVKESGDVGNQQPAGKRLKSDGGGVQRKASFCSGSSDGEARVCVEMEHMSASDPVNIEEFVSPEGDAESSRISEGTGSDSDMDILSKKI